MRAEALVLAALVALGGCAATQEPVKTVEAGRECDSCECQLEALRTRSGADLEACNKARLAGEACCHQKDALEQQLQSAKAVQTEGQRRLDERGEELARCQGEMNALRQQAKADTLACDGVRQELKKHAMAEEASAKQLQRMKDLEGRLRDRLQSDIGAKNVEIDRLRSQLSVRVLDRILFKSGSAEILPQGRKVLDTVAKALAGGEETIRIEGHADIVRIGPTLKRKYFSNWELSSGRASSVARFFQSYHGIEPTRMEAVGFSKYRPIAPNDTEENRQRNRRVEIVLTPWKPVVEESAPR
jgi:chemotaxis protein MotB